MAKRRFFVPAVSRGTAELNGDDAEHLVRVLRAEVGDVYEISNNEHVWLAEVETARKSIVVFRCVERLPDEPPAATLILVSALFKFDRFEWLVEKATELGVMEIHPFMAIRTEKGLREASPKRRARWERIGVEASQQSRRARLPLIEETTTFQNALTINAKVRLMLDEDPAAPPIVECVPTEHDRQISDRISLLLGPEGGWTPDEQAAAVSAGWKPVSLGPNVLRAETAGMAGLAVARALWAVPTSGGAK
jgi:16S rRNA (uracil1498-N3)-methyltransferase